MASKLQPESDYQIAEKIDPQSALAEENRKEKDRKMTVLRKNREELKQYYFVIKQLVDREIKRKYARSFLGVIWSVLNPLMTMAVMSMIFSTIFKRTIENYPIYYLTGTIFWQLFSGATNSAMTALVDNRTLLLKVKLAKTNICSSKDLYRVDKLWLHLYCLCAHARRVSDQNQSDDVTVSDRRIFLSAVLHGNRVCALDSIRVFCGHQIPVFDCPDTLDVHVSDLLSV